MGDVIKSREKYQKGWSGGLPETPCGFGSKLSQTRIQRRWLPGVCRRHAIHSVHDIGAGDLNWVSRMEWDVEYRAFDLVPRHPAVEEFDIVRQVPPAADALMCLWVLNHLPEEEARKAVANMQRSCSDWLITTYGEKNHEFVNAWRPIESVLVREREGKQWHIGLFRL
jgi:hypothetical protein